VMEGMVALDLFSLETFSLDVFSMVKVQRWTQGWQRDSPALHAHCTHYLHRAVGDLAG
jgi:hypothetical protein